MMETLEALWCSVMHDAPMWPIHGHYTCRICGREYPVEWSQATEKLHRRGELRVYEHAVAGSHR